MKKEKKYEIELKSGFIVKITAKNLREAKASVSRQLKLSNDSDRVK